MAEGHVCGRHTTHEQGGLGAYSPEHFWNLKHGNAISCILSVQICSKIYAKYTCIWNKRRKKRTKSKKILTTIHHYLLEEDSNGQRSRVWGYIPPENFWHCGAGGECLGRKHSHTTESPPRVLSATLDTWLRMEIYSTVLKSRQKPCILRVGCWLTRARFRRENNICFWLPRTR
jgi:hypothetical protein